MTGKGGVVLLAFGLLLACTWRPAAGNGEEVRPSRDDLSWFCTDIGRGPVTGLVEVLGIGAESPAPGHVVPLVHARTLLAVEGELEEEVDLLVRPGTMYLKPPETRREPVIGTLAFGPLSSFERSQMARRAKDAQSAIGTKWLIRAHQPLVELEGVPAGSLLVWLAYAIEDDEIDPWIRRLRRECDLN